MTIPLLAVVFAYFEADLSDNVNVYVSRQGIFNNLKPI